MPFLCLPDHGEMLNPRQTLWDDTRNSLTGLKSLHTPASQMLLKPVIFRKKMAKTVFYFFLYSQMKGRNYTASKPVGPDAL